MKLILGLFALLTTSMTMVPEEFIAAHQCVPKNTLSCIVESSFVCPPGYIDGCLTNETRNHECLAADDGPSCATPLKINCPKNFQDGCLSGESETHLCLPVKGELCSSGKRISCPSGFEDSCTR